jgi:peptidoglycan/LPS O-acetylase OafA/YrhL
LNGLRVFSILWIVYGHDEFFRFMNIRNWLDSLDIIQKPGLATLTPSAYYAVDVFFWIGGFLITMGML